MCRCLLVCSCWCAASRFRKLVRAEAMFADVEWILTQSVAWPVSLRPRAPALNNTCVDCMDIAIDLLDGALEEILRGFVRFVLFTLYIVW